MTLILVILIFGVIIFLHELGHFIVAKLSGITVLGFSVGFGPAIVKKEYKGTTYAVRALPLGGYVSMLDSSEAEYDDVHYTEEQLKGAFDKAKPVNRLLVALAGAVMNFVTGILILTILFSDAKWVVDPTITDFMDGFQYESEAGLMVGDSVVSINGYHVFTYSDVVSALSIYEGEPFDFVVKRNGQRVKIEDLPLEKNIYSEDDPETPKYGIVFGIKELTFFSRIKYALNNSMTFLQGIIKSLGMLISGRAKASDMMGTVGITTELTQRAKQSMSEMWYFVAYIAINLGLVNLLPIPGLDGGKIIVIIIEWIIGRPVSARLQNIVSYIGLAAILALFVFVTYNDIIRLVGR